MTKVTTVTSSADFLDQLRQPVPEDKPTDIDNEQLLVKMVERAMYALQEIQIFASLNRVDGALNEANLAIEELQPLKDKYDEQVKIMEALSSTEMVVGDSYV